MSGAVLAGKEAPAPAGLVITTWLADARLLSHHTAPRKRPITQLLIHRGAEVPSNDPMRTKGVLDARGLSSLWTLTPDGRLWQHFDPATDRGAHATHHNVQSDSIDVQGPLTKKLTPMPGQELLRMSAAIGRKGDAASKAATLAARQAAILARKAVPLEQWSLTPAQAIALRLFVPWWCALRGIPARACSALRTFRVGGLGLADPATNVTGILAHAQVSGPGERVDGFAELDVLLDLPGIAWRGAADFWTP